MEVDGCWLEVATLEEVDGMHVNSIDLVEYVVTLTGRGGEAGDWGAGD